LPPIPDVLVLSWIHGQPLSTTPPKEPITAGMSEKLLPSAPAAPALQVIDRAVEDGPAGLPRTGVVLIGSAAAVRSMASHLATLTPSVVPTGCVLLHRFESVRDPSRELGILPPMLGFVDEIGSLHGRFGFRCALISVPADQSQTLKRLVQLLRHMQVPTRIIPTFEDLITGSASKAAARQGIAGSSAADVSALIGRTGWGVDRAAVGAMIKNKRVLITGAGGSIGSELARVVAGFSPACVQLMERAENALFEIDQHMARRFPSIKRRAILHDITDEAATKRVIADLRPQVIFHAAAHKHVPLMEDHPSHAVNNNLFGTKSIVDAAINAGCERVVMISSDKAVNPTSVMGATKRLAEMYICDRAAKLQATGSGKSTTRLSMVRFGNVLASACSVIPIWSQQLAEGHPITVTDPRMTRYFMTIPEAATLVVQAGALEQPSGTAPVYVLDMGEPISILEMAIRFLRLNGLEASIDMSTLPAGSADARIPETDDLIDAAPYPIIFTGARPGEKLYEELAYNAEQLNKTAHAAIGQWKSMTVGSSDEWVKVFSELRSPTCDKAKVVAAIRQYVPEMRAAIENAGAHSQTGKPKASAKAIVDAKPTRARKAS
jgi:FlaA1/EpsC-like NDP-sugar epimerase